MGADRSRRPAVGPDPAFLFPAITRRRLANGLELRAVEHANVPVVTFIVLVRGGLSVDTLGQEGLAALTADMVDEGTGDLSAIDVADAMARIGADYEADVGADLTLFRLTTLTRFADRGMGLLADLLIRPSLREPDLARVRKMRLDRLTQLKDHPPAVADRHFLRRLYGAHPYGHTAIGSEAALTAFALADVRRIHARGYRPSRSVVVAVGAMTADELCRCAERAFGAWDDTGVDPVDLGVAEPRAGGSGHVAIVPRPGAAQSELRIGHLVPVRRDSPDYPALIVMNAVLGGQFVSRVNLKLREEKGFTYGARTGFDWKRAGALFSLETSVHSVSTAEAVSDAWHELQAIRGERPPSPRELELAKASLTRGYPRGFETAQQVARSVSTLAAFDLPDSYFADFMPRVHAVTAADVDRVAEQYLRPDRLTTLVVGDPDVIAAPLGALGAGVPEILPTTAA
jgi:predicted Zn-dependent peptidase